MSTFPGRFADKVGVVTGAAQGIGRTVALRLAPKAAPSPWSIDPPRRGGSRTRSRRRAGTDRDHRRSRDLCRRDRRDARDAGALWPDRHPGQQCRRHDLGEALCRVRRGADRGRDPPLAVPDALVLPCGAAGNAGARCRRHRQCLFGRDARRQPRALRGGEGRRQRHHRVSRDGIRGARHPRLRRGARRHRGPAAPHPAQRRGAERARQGTRLARSWTRRSRPA